MFWCFPTERMLKKPKEPPFTFFSTMSLLNILIFLKKFFNCFRKDALLFFFDIMHQTGFSKSPKSPPFTIKKLRFLSLGYGADFRRSRLIFDMSFLLVVSMNNQILFETLYSEKMKFIWHLVRNHWRSHLWHLMSSVCDKIVLGLSFLKTTAKTFLDFDFA